MSVKEWIPGPLLADLPETEAETAQGVFEKNLLCMRLRKQEERGEREQKIKEIVQIAGRHNCMKNEICLQLVKQTIGNSHPTQAWDAWKLFKDVMERMPKPLESEVR